MLKKPICSKPCFILFVIPPPPPPPRKIEIQFGVWQFFLIFYFCSSVKKKLFMIIWEEKIIFC